MRFSINRKSGMHVRGNIYKKDGIKNSKNNSFSTGRFRYVNGYAFRILREDYPEPIKKYAYICLELPKNIEPGVYNVKNLEEEVVSELGISSYKIRIEDGVNDLGIINGVDTRRKIINVRRVSCGIVMYKISLSRPRNLLINNVRPHYVGILEELI